jgi:hypothetical protein
VMADHNASSSFRSHFLKITNRHLVDVFDRRQLERGVTRSCC